jgi:hypothetical protein
MKKFKWFWAWQDEKEEKWLHAMALAGNHLHSISLPGLYNFAAGDPSNTFYRLNYHNPQTADFEEFKNFFLSDEWHYVTKMNGWHYFSKIFDENQTPDLTTVNKAKAEKYQHVMTAFVGFLPIMLLWFPLVNNRFQSPLKEIIGALYIILLVFFTISTFKIYQRISQLREL